MKKIHCLFKRAQEGKHFLAQPEYSDECSWVPSVPTRATVKWDGTGALIHDGELYARHRAKAGKAPPEGWRHWRFQKTGYYDGEERTSGHGWVPVHPTSPEHARHRSGYCNLPDEPPDGTYELIGPGIQGNPYELPEPLLVLHGVHIVEDINVTALPAIRAFQAIEAFLSDWWMEGLVFWHEDEPVAKVTRRDFGIEWPNETSFTARTELRGDNLPTIVTPS